MPREILSYRRLLKLPILLSIVYSETFVLNTLWIRLWQYLMEHITITSFCIHLYANKSYLIDVEPHTPDTPLTPPNSNSWKIHWFSSVQLQFSWGRNGHSCDSAIKSIMSILTTKCFRSFVELCSVCFVRPLTSINAVEDQNSVCICSRRFKFEVAVSIGSSHSSYRLSRVCRPIICHSCCD